MPLHLQQQETILSMPLKNVAILFSLPLKFVLPLTAYKKKFFASLHCHYFKFQFPECHSIMLLVYDSPTIWAHIVDGVFFLLPNDKMTPPPLIAPFAPPFYCLRYSWSFLPRDVSTGPRSQWRTSLSSATSWGPIPSTHAEGGTSTVIRQGVRPGAALPLPGQGARDDADELVNTYSSWRSRSLSCHLTKWSPPLRLSWRSPSWRSLFSSTSTRPRLFFLPRVLVLLLSLREALWRRQGGQLSLPFFGLAVAAMLTLVGGNDNKGIVKLK
jgi:hypothetical protein